MIMLPTTQICSYKDCDHKGQAQPIDNFSKGNNKFGKHHWCKSCVKKYEISRKDKIVTYRKDYYQDNKKEISVKQKIYYENNKEDIHAYHKTYYQENKEYVDEHNKQNWLKNRDQRLQYNKDNKDIIREKQKVWYASPAKCKTYFDKLSTYEAIRVDPDNEELFQVQCNFCKKWFNPTNQMVQNRLGCINQYGTKQGEARLYCGDDCKKACPVYKQIIQPKNVTEIRYKERNRRYVQSELREMVLDRDEYTCQICGAKDVDLVCHHFEGIMYNPLESADADTCITVCKSCDKHIHSQDGCKHHELRCKK